jgi:predicted transcriptional regulator
VREGREEYSITQVGMQLLGDLERVRKVISD